MLIEVATSPTKNFSYVLVRGAVASVYSPPLRSGHAKYATPLNHCAMYVGLPFYEI